MIESQIKEICQKLKPVLGHRADALWLAYVTAETPQSKQDAEVFIRLCMVRHLSREVDDKSIYLPPPKAEDCAGEFHLGSVVYGDRPVRALFLRRENFTKHIGIFSITGGGKTNVGYNLLLGLLAKDIPFFVVDWKRSYRAIKTLSNARVSRVKVFSVGRKTAHSFAWNPLRGPPQVDPRTWISIVAETLEKSHISGQGVADILIDILDKKFEEFGFYDGQPKMYPNFFDVREELGRMRLKGRRMLWQDSCLRIIRTFTFGPASGAFNARSPFKLEDLLTQPVILELDQELPKPLRIFLSELFLRWIHLYRLNQGESERLRHVTILEEVHNLFPKSRLEMQVTNSLENVFREIRSFGEGLVNITQHPSLLPIYILGNCNTQIYLSLQHEDDIATAKRSLFLERGEEVYLDRLGVGEGIVKIKGRVNPCFVRFPYIPVRPGAISDAMLGSGGEEDSTTSLDSVGSY